MELKTTVKELPTTVKVSYDIVDENVNNETIKIVNSFREEENKTPIDNILPIYANPDDAGADIYATSCKYDEKNDCWVYGTNFRFEPPKGWYLEFRPRSSNRKTDCYLANSPATGDYGYRGEYLFCFKNRTSNTVATTINSLIKLIFNALNKANIINISSMTNTINNYKINNNPPYKIGERIGQMFCFPYYKIEFVKENLDPTKTVRGEGGHGSTGR